MLSPLFGAICTNCNASLSVPWWAFLLFFFLPVPDLVFKMTDLFLPWAFGLILGVAILFVIWLYFIPLVSNEKVPNDLA